MRTKGAELPCSLPAGERNGDGGEDDERQT
jgi:hypothetical protein